jgi:hypothetical protein
LETRAGEIEIDAASLLVVVRPDAPMLVELRRISESLRELCESVGAWLDGTFEGDIEAIVGDAAARRGREMGTFLSAVYEAVGWRREAA